MHQKNSLFAATRKQLLTHKNQLRPFQDETDAIELVNAFTQSCFSFFETTHPAHKEDASFYATQLKQLALRGVPTAVKFYRNIFFYSPAMNTNIPTCNYSILHRPLLNHVKEIALRTDDAYLLFCSYITRIFSPAARDLEEAFHCLEAAANMEGDYATKSAYCLAYFYGKELVNALNLSKKMSAHDEEPITGTSLINTFSSLLNWIKDYHAKPKMSLDEILRYLETLAHLGSKEAHHYLAYLYKGEENENADSILSIYLQEMKANPALADYHTKEAEKLTENILKKRFSYYFNLAFEKSMEFGSVEINYAGTKNYVTLNLNELIELDILIKHKTIFGISQQDEYNEKIHQHAAEGKLGAMYIMAFHRHHCSHPNQELIDNFLEKIVSSEFNKNNNTILRAARLLCDRQNTTERLQNAARLGCTTSMIGLGAQAFHCDLPQAIQYFKQAIAHAEPYPADDITNIIMFALREEPLDTKAKIEYYFQLGADALKELTNPRRFTCLRWIVSTLIRFFPDENNRPQIINEWLKIKLFNNINVINLPHTIKLSDRAAQLDAAFDEIADLVKSTLPAEPSMRLGR